MIIDSKFFLTLHFQILFFFIICGSLSSVNILSPMLNYITQASLCAFHMINTMIYESANGNMTCEMEVRETGIYIYMQNGKESNAS
jgi:hypothetical protein